jgi:hypothetical protein
MRLDVSCVKVVAMPFRNDSEQRRTGGPESFTDIDPARLLVALAVLLIAAHGMGSLFAQFRQPPAIGEILGGILLGPTFLAVVAPGCPDIPSITTLSVPLGYATAASGWAWLRGYVLMVVDTAGRSWDVGITSMTS